jgi:maltooligosyltrehalose trehalohydrolase
MRRYPIGAEVVTRAGGGPIVDFRLWAPACTSVQVLLEAGPGAPDRIAMVREADGYFSVQSESAGAGTRYRFLLNGGEQGFPDPASRFQPEGPFFASEVIDPVPFQWTDQEWRGPRLEGQVVYEMHIGTFTREGTWVAATAQLEELSRLGISVLEIMPVADFAGEFGWGYDGVDLFAPAHCYGRPDEFRTFVDSAHAVNIGVILDVVYNHLGPDGNYLKEFSPEYFTDRYENDWGEAINFDGSDSGPVREFYITNAKYWIDEYHLDGLRLDATQQIFDSSKPHIVRDVVSSARSAAAGKRLLIVGENEPQEVKYARSPEDGGYGLDALWNDDFHHSMVVALTGRYEAYYTDYRGTPQECISAYKYGYLYQGQEYSWQKKRR